MAYQPGIYRYTRWTLIGLIRLYQALISPVLPPACRYSPTCSEFAAVAIDQHGALRGIGLAIGRLFRCHPWGRGGFDPVPRPPAQKGKQTTP